MSSAAFSQLTLELKTPWVLLAVFTGWLVLIAVCLWQVDAPFPGSVAIAIGTVIALGLPALGTQLFGLVPWALRRIILLPSGDWRLTDTRGREWTATLINGRALRRVALLKWQSGSGRHWALVTRNRADPDAFRRLRVRLNFAPI